MDFGCLVMETDASFRSLMGFSYWDIGEKLQHPLKTICVLSDRAESGKVFFSFWRTSRNFKKFPLMKSFPSLTLTLRIVH